MFSPDTVVWAEKLLTGTPDTSRPHAPPPCVRVQRELPRGPHVSRRPSNHSSPHLYTSHPHRLPASPPSGPPDTSRHYSSSQVPIRVYLAHTSLSSPCARFLSLERAVARPIRVITHACIRLLAQTRAPLGTWSGTRPCRAPVLATHTGPPFIHPFESPSHPSHPARPTVHIRAPTRTHMQWCPCVWSRLFPSPTLRLLCALRLPNFTAKSLQVLVRKFTSLWQPHAHATLTAPRLRRGGGTPRAAEEVRAGASCRSRRPARTERARADSEDGWRPPRRQSPLSRRRATHGP